ncbi:MBL fold metallo-hydrolase [Streptomyces uncialis]|uniref:MBL fold metallo-hydrolase n=1 Tax=Streptomyces uncialis TaxID=1048205 RepID=UPI003820E360
MELTRITSDVRQLPFPVGNVHIVRPPDGYALIDTGVPGSAPAILEALGEPGARPQDVRRIVLAHCHVDHMGSAADLVEGTGSRVPAGALDAPFVQGTAPEPETVLTTSERALHERVLRGRETTRGTMRSTNDPYRKESGPTRTGTGRPRDGIPAARAEVTGVRVVQRPRWWDTPDR